MENLLHTSFYHMDYHSITPKILSHPIQFNSKIELKQLSLTQKLN